MIIFGIEDMIANAIIELVERGSRREVLFSEANRYVEEVVQILSQQNKNAIFVTSKDGLNDFLHDNSDFFELISNGKENGVRLRSNFTARDLWGRFRGYLPVSIMMTFLDDQAVRKLGCSV